MANPREVLTQHGYQCAQTCRLHIALGIDQMDIHRCTPVIDQQRYQAPGGDVIGHQKIRLAGDTDPLGRSLDQPPPAVAAEGRRQADLAPAAHRP